MAPKPKIASLKPMDYIVGARRKQELLLPHWTYFYRGEAKAKYMLACPFEGLVFSSSKQFEYVRIHAQFTRTSLIKRSPRSKCLLLTQSLNYRVFIQVFQFACLIFLSICFKNVQLQSQATPVFHYILNQF